MKMHHLLMTLFILSTANSFAQETKNSEQPLKRLNIKSRVVPSSDKTEVKFKSVLTGLESDLKKEKNLDKKIKMLNKATDELSALKEKGERPEDEKVALEMALIVDTLDSFKREKKMDLEKCKSSLNETKNQFAPEHSVVEPGVERALRVLKAVCDK